MGQKRGFMWSTYVLTKLSRLFEIVIAKNQQKNEITAISTTNAIRKITYVQHYGFASSIFENSECYVFNRNGEQGNSFIFATKTDQKPDLEQGEVCLYDNKNNLIKLSDAGIEIQGGKLVINCPVEIKNTLKTTDDISTTRDVKAGLISLQNHTHISAAAGSPTTVPVVT